MGAGTCPCDLALCRVVTRTVKRFICLTKVTATSDCPEDDDKNESGIQIVATVPANMKTENNCREKETLTLLVDHWIGSCPPVLEVQPRRMVLLASLARVTTRHLQRVLLHNTMPRCVHTCTCAHMLAKGIRKFTRAPMLMVTFSHVAPQSKLHMPHLQ